MIRIAVLGCGRIGRMHANNISNHRDAELATVFDLHMPSANDVASSHNIQAADTAEEIFASDSIDAILIATATPTHADYVEMAVAANKPVLCEKPIDLSLDRVNQCAERIKGSNVAIQLGFNRRFDPGHKHARDVAHSGEIGDLHQVIITSRDPEMPPRSYYEEAGGFLRDMTIHDFDLARYMLGDEPVEVMAMAGGMIDPELMNELNDHDTAMIVMRTADGKQCHINNSRTAVYGYDQRVELLGTGGMVLSDNRRNNEVKHYSATATEVASAYQFFFIERYAEAFIAELSSFISAVESGTSVEVGFEDGRRALLLAEAAYRSIAESRTVRVDELE